MPQPLTDAINALTTYANTVTGKSPPDTTLSDAVATLASGWNNSGSSSGYTPNPNKPLTSAIESLTYYANSVTGASDQTLSEAVATLATGYHSETWDYEWYATSGTTPTGATYSGSPSFTDDYMTVTNLNMTLINFTGGFEIKAVINHNRNATSNTPQVGLKNSSTKYGAKIYLNSSKKLTAVGMTVDGSITVDATFHEYDIKYENGTFTAYYDGVQVATGAGRYNNNYDATLVAGAASYSYKSICYRAL